MPNSSTSNPKATNIAQTTSSHDSRLQFFFRLARNVFMGSQSEEILYLKMRWRAETTTPKASHSQLLRRGFASAYYADDLLLGKIPNPAMVPAIGKINHQAYNQPADQAGPVNPAEFVHHVAIEDDTQQRNDG